MNRDLFADQLKALRAAALDRHLSEIGTAQGPEIEIAGRRLINFSSNDYLGLANNPRLREAAIAAINEFGVGAEASRLISGTQSPHLRLERVLAKSASEALISYQGDRLPAFAPRLRRYGVASRAVSTEIAPRSV